MDTGKYNKDWFRERALNSLVRIAPHAWDFSDSLLLYISSGVEAYESLQEIDTPYYNLVTKPEREYIQSVAKDIVALLPEKFEYIDLGPGTEHKEQFFFDECKKQGKQFVYVPVDISTHYLQLAQKHAVEQGISVRTMQASFEELPQLLPESAIPRFVHIGLTFSNYEPHIILALLKDIAGKNGFACINAQIRERVDMKLLQKVYAEDAKTLADDKLRLLGLDPQTDVSPRAATDDIRVWCSILNPSPELVLKGVAPGDTFLVFQSLRYTKDQLESELQRAGGTYQVLDTGSSFVAGVLKT